MSRETIEILRNAYEALNRDDLAAIYGSLDPDIHMESPPLIPGAPSFSGHEGFGKAWRTFRSSWEELRYEPAAFVVSGDDVLVEAKIHGRAKGSGAETEVAVFHLWTMRDGKAVRWRSYIDRDEALEAVARAGSQ